MKTFPTILIFFISLIAANAQTDAERIKELENKVNSLEQRLNNLERAFHLNLAQQKMNDTTNVKLRMKAKERMKEDENRYTAEELKDLESIYQKASDDMKSPQSKTQFQELITKYPKSNRSGCAALYLAQTDKSEKQEQMLKDVIEKFSDCMYLDGVQVGPYARYYLAKLYLKKDETKKSEDQIEYIRKNYPDTIDHQGRKLIN